MCQCADLPMCQCADVQMCLAVFTFCSATVYVVEQKDRLLSTQADYISSGCFSQRPEERKARR
jgi:hypothetical protein